MGDGRTEPERSGGKYDFVNHKQLTEIVPVALLNILSFVIL